MKLRTMNQNQDQTSPATRKISNYIMLIVFIVVVLSVVALIVAGNAYFIGDYAAAGVFAIIGLIALTMSLFTFYQSRRQGSDMKIEIPKVMTTIQCTNKECDSKTVREFQRGDFVFKELEQQCQKCTGKQMVTAIFKEVKEKEKTYPV